MAGWELVDAVANDAAEGGDDDKVHCSSEEQCSPLAAKPHEEEWLPASLHGRLRSREDSSVSLEDDKGEQQHDDESCEGREEGEDDWTPNAEGWAHDEALDDEDSHDERWTHDDEGWTDDDTSLAHDDEGWAHDDKSRAHDDKGGEHGPGSPPTT